MIQVKQRKAMQATAKSLGKRANSGIVAKTHGPSQIRGRGKSPINLGTEDGNGTTPSDGISLGRTNVKHGEMGGRTWPRLKRQPLLPMGAGMAQFQDRTNPAL